MTEEPVRTGTTAAGRLDAECRVCDMGVDAPESYFGEAIIAAFRAQHRHGAED